MRLRMVHDVSSLEAFFIVVVVLAGTLCGTYWMIQRLQQAACVRDRLIAAARDSYEGPNSLRLMQDIDDHLDATALFDDELADVFGPGAVKPAAELLEEQ